ncbi:sporulation histidine kinase inhibitor Sda [Radiobacillus kanasensis]|nr:sporulation histidine kinase inhibitor Sda [Radiobacillus kanasensis]UFU00298.1 sporulation histidine kinase inhibitor Sda [Radiobacillus kanasensis]
MDYLSDKVLIEAYKKAVTLELSEEFLKQIEEELKKRKICLILLEKE